MNAMVWISALLACLLAGCATHREERWAAPEFSEPTLTEADAIDIVLADIQRRGEDPGREQCSAEKTGEGWSVKAWHIYYPDNVGVSRFVPGGFAIYSLSREGEILGIRPGR
jgi:hypothetical protein